MRSKGIFPSRITSAVECSAAQQRCFFEAPELIRLFRVYNMVLKALQITTHCASVVTHKARSMRSLKEKILHFLLFDPC